MLRVEQLIIIGGPSCVGKSYLIEKIRRGDCPELCAQLGMDNPASWRYVTAKKLSYIPQPQIERLVVHYDFIVQYSEETGYHHLHDLITNASMVNILTLKASENTLIRRINSRLIQWSISLIKRKGRKLRMKRLWKIWKIRKAYKRGETEGLYERWFNYLNQFSETGLWLIDSSQSYGTTPQAYQQLYHIKENIG